MTAAPHDAAETRSASDAASAVHPKLGELLRRHWGFDTLRPLQAEAIRAGLDGRDSLVVMPTGGGKSLCYQVPPLLTGRLCVVVSPLIALMKDQIDGLKMCGVPAAAVHGNLAADEIRQIERGAAEGEYRLLFAAPERLLAPRFLDLLARTGVAAFAIDEAHCISQWGHDFRPEYRRLAELRGRFPQAPLHAFTATATERVRRDIVEQLRLRDPALLVGTFDRPNLQYRVLPKTDVVRQCAQILAERKDEAAIIYCISRRDTEDLAGALTAAGLRARAYHAGLDADVRRAVQDDFARERLNIVCATVAFGMGIDRSNVRCIIHASMPKTIEHYQQETGRAGRDGLAAECVVLYSASDAQRWRRLIEKSAESAPDPGAVIAAQRELLDHMNGFITGMVCRHRQLSEYFGQAYPNDNCQACDICAGETEAVEGALEIAQKIISCVARLKMGFGARHIADIVRGRATKRILERGHDKLSTFGLLAGMTQNQVVSAIDQLIHQGALGRAGTEFPLVTLGRHARAVLKGERQVSLLAMKGAAEAEAGGGSSRRRYDQDDWTGVDAGLFEALRALRRELADERQVPAFVILSDVTLRDLARLRPTTRERLLRVRGIGENKAAQFGEALMRTIGDYCRQSGVSTDETPPAPAPVVRLGGQRQVSAAKRLAFELFRRAESIDEVAQAAQRSRGTVGEYLCEFIHEERPASIDAWVDRATQQRIIEAADATGNQRLKPIHDYLDGVVPYELIRATLLFEGRYPGAAAPETRP